MTVTAVVQARMSSTRLPGKVLLPLEGVPILTRIHRALMRASSVDRVVVATGDASADDPVADWGAEQDVEVVRADPRDVLARFAAVLTAFADTDVLVRVTADCPFIDADLVDEVVRELRSRPADFVGNRMPPPLPRSFPIGLDVEACTARALRVADEQATQPHQREHVMPYLYENPDRFVLSSVVSPEPLGGLRWTVDTPEDYRAAQEIARIVGPEPVPWRVVLEATRAHPWIAEINATSVQKAVTDYEAPASHS